MWVMMKFANFWSRSKSFGGNFEWEIVWFFTLKITMSWNLLIKKNLLKIFVMEFWDANNLNIGFFCLRLHLKLKALMKALNEEFFCESLKWRAFCESLKLKKKLQVKSFFKTWI
jgi:hypothetical protein